MKGIRFTAVAVLSLCCNLANAASVRDNWVVQEVYSYNHPFATQLPGELATKMSKMAASPFSFYRGTAHVYYRDTATLPASAYLNTATSKTWLVGDIHLQNMGAFRDANSNYVFGVTDFDENYWGPWTWDIRRMAVSIMLAAKENGLSSTDQQQLTRDFLDAYFNKINDFRGTSDELSYRLTSGNTGGVVKDTVEKSEGDTRSSLLSKYTAIGSDGKRTFITTSDLQPVLSSTYSGIQGAMTAYINSISSSKRYASSYYTIKDIRLKLGSGIGSLGRYRYLLLVEGPSSSTGDDVILTMKQETASAVSIANPGAMPASVYGYNEGGRAAKGMKAGLTNTDVLVGYTAMSGMNFLLREKAPYDEDFDYTLLTTYAKFSEAVGYMGKALATVHSVSDQDYDATLISYSMDKQIDDVTANAKTAFKTETVNFATDYALQVQYDWQSFVNAYNAGTPLY
jgi:uncharacterized protein (DUF2252 family)